MWVCVHMHAHVHVYAGNWKARFLIKISAFIQPSFTPPLHTTFNTSKLPTRLYSNSLISTRELETPSKIVPFLSFVPTHALLESSMAGVLNPLSSSPSVLSPSSLLFVVLHLYCLCVWNQRLTPRFSASPSILLFKTRILNAPRTHQLSLAG